MGDQFAPFFEYFADTLLKQCSVRVKVIANSGRLCVQSIILNCIAPRIVPKIVAGLKSRSKDLRERCIEFLLVLLEAWPIEPFAKYRDSIYNVIKATLSDSSSHVRVRARRCYWAFKQHYNDMAVKMMKGLDSQQQKYLYDELKGGGDSQSMSSTGGSRSSVGSSSSSRRPGTAPVKKTRPSSGANSGTGKKGHGSRKSNGSASSSSGSKERPSTTSTTAKTRISSAGASRTKSSRGGKTSGAQRVNLGSAGRQGSGTRLAGGASRVVALTTETSSNSQEISEEDDYETEYREQHETLVYDTSIKSLIRKAQASDWSLRVQAFTTLAALYKSQQGQAKIMTGSNFEKLIVLYEERLSDPHHKVALAVLQSFMDLLVQFNEHMEGQLDRFVGKLFLRLVDNKEAVRHMTAQVLQLIGDMFGPNALMPCLFKVLGDETNASIRLGITNYIVGLFEVAREYLRMGNHMKFFVYKFLELTKDKNQELRKRAIVALTELYDLDTEHFLLQANTLSPTNVIALRKTLERFIEGIEYELGPQEEALDEQEPEVQSNSEGYSKAFTQPRNNTSAGGYSSLHQQQQVYHQEQQSNEVTQEETVQEDEEAEDEEDDEGMPRFLYEIANFKGEQRFAGLDQVIELSQANQAAFWEQHFGQILLEIINALQDTNAEVRELCLAVIKEMISNQHEYFTDYLHVVTTNMLGCFGDDSREVSQAAEEALEQLIVTFDAQDCIDILNPLISSQDGALLQLCIRLMSQTLSQVEDAEYLHGQLPSILPGLFAAFNNPLADVRKAVVFCLVDLYMRLGDDFTPYLTNLSTSQLKLVTIYINRMRAKSNGS
eukprot:TRINITY_DN3060_c1_g2_i1.p1 TRINITY_DN3060_c1_g2~~TRINITY_DN3060_c1_g2_i1.p1  ORF type:complete len:832 (+),score=288.88 TRINITY_DN3060_c1_g2_i1:275-2770(+)